MLRIIIQRFFFFFFKKETGLAILFYIIESSIGLSCSIILKKDISITVITNMIDVMHLLYHSNNIKLIGIGGTLNKELDGFVGSVSIDQIKKYKSDKAFIGVVGIDTVSGSLTTFDSEDGLTKEAIINSAKKRYLITERQKTFQDGNFIYSNIDEFDGIISDDIPKDIKTSIKKKGLNII